MPIVNDSKDSAEQKVTKCHVLREARTPYHGSDNGFNSQQWNNHKPLVNGGKDSAEQKVTKCHVL